MGDDDVTGLTRPLWGLQAPIYYGVTEQGRFVSREEHYGHPVLLLLAGRAALPALAAVVSDMGPSMPALATQGAQVFIVLDQDPRMARQAGILLDGMAAIDCGGFVQRAGVAPGGIMGLLLDRGQRVLLQFHPANAPGFAQRCVDLLAAQQSLPAPVVIRPGLLPPEWCTDLITLFENSLTMDGEVARVDAQGQACNVVDHNKKRRRDMSIAEGTGLHAALVERLFTLCRPEIARAFQVDVVHVDRMLLARYDAEAGWFRRHRDNTAEQVAFRQFALSVNLNTGGYEGGELHFPEYNDTLYSPPAGGGLLFSASMMHEVVPVRSGQRYVLLTFMHSEAAESRRLRYERAQAQEDVVDA